MSKKIKKLYTKDYRVYMLVNAVVSKIIENRVINNKTKLVFTAHVKDGVKDERFKLCIAWERFVIEPNDNITMKGYFLKNAFYVKSLINHKQKSYSYG